MAAGSWARGCPVLAFLQEPGACPTHSRVSNVWVQESVELLALPLIPKAGMSGAPRSPTRATNLLRSSIEFVQLWHQFCLIIVRIDCRVDPCPVAHWAWIDSRGRIGQKQT